MVEASERTVRTYWIGFEEQTHDELPYGRAVATHLGTDDLSTTSPPSMLSVCSPSLPITSIEPFGDPSALPTIRIAELAGNDLKVVLTGDGGDESFGGYTPLLRHASSGRLAPTPGSRLLTATLDTLLSHSPAPTRLRQRAAWWRRLVRINLTSDTWHVLSIVPQPIITPVEQRPQLADQGDYLLDVLRAVPRGSLDACSERSAHLSAGRPARKVNPSVHGSLTRARSPLLDQELIESRRDCQLSSRSWS